jgi:hypothetical protein
MAEGAVDGVQGGVVVCVAACSAGVGNHEQPSRLVPTGRPVAMKLLRSAAAIGLAKKFYDEARKPENQRRIRAAVDNVKAKRQQRRPR